MSTVNLFNNVVVSGDYVVLDTETTGLHKGEICEIAIVARDGSTAFHSLVRTRGPIPLIATRIHGITDDAVASAPIWPDILPELVRLLSGTNVVVYNAVYDRRMMHQSSEIWGLPKTDWKTLSPWWCAMQEFAAIYGEWSDYGMSYKYKPLWVAARHYHLEFERAHSALGDAWMTWRIARKMAGVE